MALRLQPGEEPIPGYILEEALGAGGFGEVWRALAPGGIPVALKFIRLGGDAAKAEERSLQTVCRLRHAFLLEIHWARQVDDRLVIATSLCDGSLLDRLKACRKKGLAGIPRLETLEYIEQAAKALDYLNEPRHLDAAGNLVSIVHRDIKPANIFLLEGCVKVADFGLAKIMERSATGHTGAMTPHYAPPEMFHGEVSDRSDQYSLAATYYQLRTGALPFTGDRLTQLMYRIINDPPDLSRLTDPKESAVVEQALAKDSRDRWPSCIAFTRALQQVRVNYSAPIREADAPSGARNSMLDEPSIPHEPSTLNSPGLGAEGDTSRRSTPPAVEDIDEPPTGESIVWRPPRPMPGMAKAESKSVRRFEPLPNADRARSDHSGATSRNRWLAAAMVSLISVVSAVIFFTGRVSTRPNIHANVGQNAAALASEESPKAAPVGDALLIEKSAKDAAVEVEKVEWALVESLAPETEKEAKPVEPLFAVYRLAVTPEHAKIAVEGTDARVEGTGAERILSIPVSIDEKPLASTPFLVASAPGYERYRLALRPTAVADEAISVALTPLPAVLTLNISPPDAKISVDGEGREIVALTANRGARQLRVVRPDLHRKIEVLVSKEGFKQLHRVLPVSPGKLETIDLRLEPLPAVYRLSVAPAEADIVIEGVEALIDGDSAARIATIPMGSDFRNANVLVKATFPNYQPFERRLNPKPGTDQTLEVSLTPEPAVFELRLEPSDSTVVIPESNIRTSRKGASSLIVVDRSDTVRRLAIRVARANYETIDRVLEPAPGKQETIRIRLKAVPAVYDLTIDPPDADVSVDDSRASIIGAGPSRRLTVDQPDDKRTVTLTAALDGYEDAERLLSPQPGESEKLSLILQPTARFLSAPFSKTQAEQSQSAWARRLDTDVVLKNSIGMELTLIPPGEFMMGNHMDAEETSRRLGKELASSQENFGDEAPRHKVRINRPFFMGTHEITVAQFRQFVVDSKYVTDFERDGKGGYGLDVRTGRLSDYDGADASFSWKNPGWPQSDEHPVINVTWNDAQAFLAWLSRKESRAYRLPTEAEWEYACRAGTETSYYVGEDPVLVVRVGNVADASLQRRNAFIEETLYIDADDGFAFTSPVGRFSPNSFGLYDMHGNVWEWCKDRYAFDYYRRSPIDDPQGPQDAEISTRTLRGGSFTKYACCVRSSERGAALANYSFYDFGFRAVAEP